MEQVARFAIRILAAVMAFVAAMSLLAAVLSLQDEKNGGLLIFIGPVVFSLIAWCLWRRSSGGASGTVKTAADQDRLISEARSYFGAVNGAGEFPRAQADRLISSPDDPLLATCNAKLFEVSEEQARNYLGTRVMVGKLPVYMGRSAAQSREVLRQASEGELGITPTSIIFNGPTRSAIVQLDRIIAVEVMSDGFTVAARGQSKPVVFVVSNGLLWGALVRNLVQIKLQGRALPVGQELRLDA
ncbi:hypothetical protein [Methylibium sp.]|uniref:hypothetical protein n=1 Tax=Methylibium sp. TaxID=2067992 RepID=UPI003D0B1D78